MTEQITRRAFNALAAFAGSFGWACGFSDKLLRDAEVPESVGTGREELAEVEASGPIAAELLSIKLSEGSIRLDFDRVQWDIYAPAIAGHEPFRVELFRKGSKIAEWYLTASPTFGAVGFVPGVCFERLEDLGLSVSSFHIPPGHQGLAEAAEREVLAINGATIWRPSQPDVRHADQAPGHRVYN